MKKQLFKISLLSMFLLAGMNVFAQRVAEKKADKEYQTQAYVDAINIYERIAKKGYTNADLLKKLADAYYFNGKLPQANQWYQELFEGEYDDKGKDAIASEYYYRYAQTLKSVQDYDKSKLMMERFAKLESDDSRAQLFMATKDHYLKDIENNSERYDLKNLSLNTEYSDYGATLLGNQLVYTSARNTDHQSGKQIHDWTNESFTSLFSSVINEDGTFQEPQRFAPELETKVNEATAVFTSDGKTIYFTRNNTSVKGKRRLNKDNSTLLKLYKATLSEHGKWTNVEELPFNSDNFNTAHPALTPDDKWLYFSSDRQGTIGESDIFRVALYPTGEYGNIENLGRKVNTSGRENFPFISKDNFLFFSSDGHPGIGGLDVFVAKINVDGSIGNVSNMGIPINSSTDDFAFYIDSKTRKGFVSSNRANGVGGDDIYFFMEKACQQALEGVVLDADSKQAIANAKVTVYSNSYATIAEIITDAKGYYKLENLECNQKYRIKAEALKFNTQEVVILTDAKAASVKKQDILLEKTEKLISKNDDLSKTLKLEPIYFDFDKSDIRRDASIELIKVIEVLKQNPKMKIDVRSHTDSRGDDNYNLKLSERRAKSTVAWIISQGIDQSRVTGKGYGETQLQNNCSNGVPCTTQEHQLNRRSEFIILSL